MTSDVKVPIEPAAFSLPVRVYIEDTDAGGVVYHANYLKYFERARSDWLDTLGVSQRTLLSENCQFVVVSCQLDFVRPALLNDQLTVALQVERLRAASIDFLQQALRNGELLCRAKIKVACIDALTKKPAKLPDVLMQHLQS